MKIEQTGSANIQPVDKTKTNYYDGIKFSSYSCKVEPQLIYYHLIITATWSQQNTTMFS